MSEEKTLAEKIGARLAKYIGENNARVAMKTFVPRAVGVSPEKLTLPQVPAVLEAMLPMLRTLLGAQAAQKLIDDIKKEYQS